VTLSRAPLPCLAFALLLPAIGMTTSCSSPVPPRAPIPATASGPAKPLPALDPQQVQDQDAMTWDDYRPIPGIDWADPALKPKRDFRLAVVAIDFEDQPFVITLPRKSDPFGNPQPEPVKREAVPQFYADFSPNRAR
jgi:hypothetical protein